MFEILQFDFVTRAFIAGMVIAVTAPLIGIFLVVRRYSLMADTLSHVSLAGVAVGLLLGINPFLAALGASCLAALSIEKIRGTQKFFGESVLALFLFGSLALAIVLISFAKGLSINIVSFLFGSISTVGQEDLYIIIGLGVLVIVSIALFYKELFFIAFHEELARANGISITFFNVILVLLAAVVVSLAMRVVGVLLVGALMVIPVLSAMQLGKGFRKTLFLAIIYSCTATLLGLTFSYFFDLASGGSVVLVALGIFFITWFLANESK